MCGIFAVINDESLFGAEGAYEGLKRLEYRGYDSWGIAVQKNHRIELMKEVGKISSLKKFNGLSKARTAIAHTRWATTGGVTRANAHPHLSTDKSFVLAQNGIVENYEELKQNLIKRGYRFVSETDTEVIVRQIEEESKTSKNFINAVRTAFHKLEGRNTIIILTNITDEIIAARNGSPLVVGFNEKTNKVYVSSDVLSFAPWADKMIVLENGPLVHVVKNKIKIYDLLSGKEIRYRFEKVQIKSDKVDKEGYPHFMLKEINESPTVIQQLTKQEKKHYEELAKQIRQSTHVYCIGSGTAGCAAAQMAFYLREIAGITTTALVGADARDYYGLFKKTDLIIAPSP